MENQIEIYGIRSIIEAIEASKEISKVYLLKTNSSQSSLLRSLIILLERKNIKSSSFFKTWPCNKNVSKTKITLNSPYFGLFHLLEYWGKSL